MAPQANMWLRRTVLTDRVTVGELDLAGAIKPQPTIYTLEDAVRYEKIPKITAIPLGLYRVVLRWSNRCQRVVPALLDVPNFTLILIHSGNTEADTEGCVLVGFSFNSKTKALTRSRDALGYVVMVLRGMEKQGPVWLSVECGVGYTDTRHVSAK